MRAVCGGALGSNRASGAADSRRIGEPGSGHLGTVTGAGGPGRRPVAGAGAGKRAGIDGASASRQSDRDFAAGTYIVLHMAGSNRMFSRDLVQRLIGFGERPWGELSRGKEVTEVWLARQLRLYGIKPRTIRIGESVAKGYVQKEHMEAFRRYIPKSAFEALKAEVAERTAGREESSKKDNRL